MDGFSLPGLAEALARIRAGTLDIHDYVDACYDRIDSRETSVGAWQHLLERARYHAFLEENRERLAGTILRGLPIGIKDVFDTQDMPTTLGSVLHAQRRPSDDAASVAALRAAGAVIMGKTVTTEFAYFSPGKTANPRDLGRTPGGSSSGSAAAVADFMVPVALGSQTAASVIRPAAYCGTVAYVATRGLMSLRGVQPLAQSFDSLGILARHFDDLGIVASILAGVDVSADAELPRSPRILVVNGGDIGPCSEAMQEAVDEAAGIMARNGATVRRFEAADKLAELVQLHGLIMAYEAARNMVAEYRQPAALSPEFRALLEKGRTTSFETYVTGIERIGSLYGWLEDALADADAILAPAAPDVAPEGRAQTGSPHMSRPWQALGLPVVAFTAATDSGGLPLGVQLIANRWRDGMLLRLGHWVDDLMRRA